ncbi:DUF2510 domain-containing protein [Streptomyces sp. NPDC091212]|uniref:DUF2510 domain-containing protein n=1 Tax=Streptomyces sp. NPDC091212 TaxID=3155191 RepID=UPI00344555C4
MSMTTPPGWYPDPTVPSTERWWDGTAWTAHARPLGGAVPPEQPQQYPVQPSFQPPFPGQYGQGQQPYAMAVGQQTVAAEPSGAARTWWIVGACALVATLVVTALVTGVLTPGGDDRADGGAAARSGEPGVSPGTDGKSPSAGSGTEPDAVPADDPTVLVDQLNGITLPILDGWEEPDYGADDAPTMKTVDLVDCPGSGGTCRHGTVSSRTASGAEGTSAKDLAEEDISKAAEAAYGKDGLGISRHGGITSHKTLTSGPAVVAGRTGHLVRWRVTTGAGPGGYVQSLVFPSAVGSESLIIVRFAFDAGPDGPPVGGMDTITKGIRQIEDGSGGVGSSVGS